MSTPGERLPETHPAPQRPAVAAAPAGGAVAPVDPAVSWAAILAGAAAAAALSLVLVILGLGLGLSAVSPWAFEGVDADTFGWSTIAWICITSILAAGMGGYLAGRLRTRWTGVHADETYFRDTAHGFLAWAVATLLTAAVLTTAIGGILGTGAKAGAGGGLAAVAAGGAAADGEAADEALDYHVDQLLRRAPGQPQFPQTRAPDADGQAQAPRFAPLLSERDTDASAFRDEVRRVFIAGLRDDGLDDEDARYLAERLAVVVGIDAQQAQARVDQTWQRLESAHESALEAVDEARKATAYAALWLFISLLMGAFVASLMATFGGRQRDA